MLEEQSVPYGFVHQSEDEKLLKDIRRSDMEKFLLFTQLLRRNYLLKTAAITHTK